jgi:hypothetical protein
MTLHTPQLGTGVVRHRRLKPRVHAFEYPTYFLMLPMRSLRTAPAAALRRNRFGLLSFHDRDHGDGRGDALAWLEELLASEGVADANGEVWLHTYPRVLGYVFKPVSFWHCQRADGTGSSATPPQRGAPHSSCAAPAKQPRMSSAKSARTGESTCPKSAGSPRETCSHAARSSTAKCDALSRNHARTHCSSPSASGGSAASEARSSSLTSA